MIYLDCAATSMQKPRAVHQAVERAMRTMASPGRGSHAPAMHAADTAFACRSEAAALFHMDAPENVVLTFNATHGLNIAVNALVRPGDKVVISGFEHNAVTRPLRLHGAQIAVAAGGLFDPDALTAGFAAALPGAKAAVCTMMSNVFGYITPIADIAAQCRKAGVPLIIDAAQGAGCLDLDFPALGADFAAMPGHKGLLGPQGTGLLLCARPAPPLLAGGTGSDSANPEMPAFLPDRLEAGTHNIPGIAGLLEGIRFVRRQGTDSLLGHETALLGEFAGRIGRIPDLEVFRAENPALQGGVLSVRHPRIDCEALAAELGQRGVAVRAGLHCAPLAHATAGTRETGTLRFSFSPFNTRQETAHAAAVLGECVKKLDTGAK